MKFYLDIFTLRVEEVKEFNIIVYYKLKIDFKIYMKKSTIYY